MADIFGLALLDRDPSATAEQVDNAKDKAHRAPLLMLIIARLAGSAPALENQRSESGEQEVSDAERLVSLGCAIQNMLLSTNTMGFGTGLTSGQALVDLLGTVRMPLGCRPCWRDGMGRLSNTVDVHGCAGQ